MRGFRAWHTRLNRYFKDDEFYVDSDGSVWALFETDDDGILETRYTGRCTRKDFDNGYIIREDSTGLKDKNGREIYEGDIVKFNETICIVEFEEMYARYTLRDQSDDVVMSFDILIIIPFGVVGNFHENPELLEGEE